MVERKKEKYKDQTHNTNTVRLTIQYMPIPLKV